MFVSSFFACLRRFQEKIHPQTSPSIFSGVLGPPSQVFTRDSSITQGPGCGVGRGRGNPHNGVAFSIELLEWGRKFSNFGGK